MFSEGHLAGSLRGSGGCCCYELVCIRFRVDLCFHFWEWNFGPQTHSRFHHAGSFQLLPKAAAPSPPPRPRCNFLTSPCWPLGWVERAGPSPDMEDPLGDSTWQGPLGDRTGSPTAPGWPGTTGCHAQQPLLLHCELFFGGWSQKPPAFKPERETQPSTQQCFRIWRSQMNGR